MNLSHLNKQIYHPNYNIVINILVITVLSIITAPLQSFNLIFNIKKMVGGLILGKWFVIKYSGSLNKHKHLLIVNSTQQAQAGAEVLSPKCGLLYFLSKLVLNFSFKTKPNKEILEFKA